MFKDYYPYIMYISITEEFLYIFLYIQIFNLAQQNVSINYPVNNIGILKM